MAKLEDLLRGLRVEDLPEEFAGLAPLVTSLDAAITTLGNAVLGNLTLGDNLSVEKLEVQLTHGVAQTVALKKLRRVGSVIGFSAGTDSSGNAHAFLYPPEVKPSSTPGMASVTAYFKNNAAVRVACSVWVEGTGQSSSKTASDTAWTAPTLLNGWANQAGFMPSGYLMDANGFVHLRGEVTNAAGTAGGNPIFTLPAGYRPSARVTAVGWDASAVNAACRIDIDTSGNVFPTAAAAAGDIVAFNGITFDIRS